MTMPESAVLNQEQFAACAQLAMAPESEFGAIYRFIPEFEAPRLLAMEALFRSLRDIPLSVSDPSVGMAKLGWWHKELGEAEERGSQHPVVQSLMATNALDMVASEDFSDYLHALMLTLQDERLSSVVALETWLKETAGREAMLLARGQLPDAAIGQLGSAARLLELIRTLSRQQAEHAWLPMDLIARHGTTGDESGRKEARCALVTDLAGLALRMAEGDSLQARGPGASFLVLRNRLVASRLKRAAKRPQDIVDSEVKGRLGEVFAVWSTAGKLMRSDAWDEPGIVRNGERA